MTTVENKIDINRIKKELYKQNPRANLLCIRKGIAYYDAKLKFEENNILSFKTIFFEIPVSDMGDADFTSQMDGKLLNRWIVNI